MGTTKDYVMAFGVDYSFARPNLDKLKEAGVTFIVRYLWPNTTGSKGLSRAEYDQIKARGMNVVYVYEEDGSELTGGGPAGIRVAQRAKQIIAQQGLPMQPIYFAIDHDYSGPALAACVEAVKAASTVLGAGMTGIYGGYNHIVSMQAARACGFFWQTYAWSGGRVATGIHLYQYRNGQNVGGGSVDFCESRAANYGQSGTAVEGGGATPIQEEDMGLPISFVKDAQSATIWVMGPIGYVGVQSPYHVTLLTRAQKNMANDPMLHVEMDIVASYLRTVGAIPFPAQQPANVQLTPAQLEQLQAALATGIPHEFDVTGKAVAK
jgi:hypothetical protein